MENMSINRALSREGHAAMSMRGGDDRWILIQKNTFTNWVNEQLRNHGTTDFVKELVDDFDDGIRLCALIEELQGKRIGKVIKKPLNHHQNLENVTLALTAIANDNVRLVNIGSEDIVNGSLKLILGLIWHLILRYQIGKTKFPAKKLMLAWLRAVIPECSIGNFTRDWNDGVALHALIEYCQPGLSPQWRYMSKSDQVGNCQTAMDLAQKHFGIPLVVRPEDLASPDLDELSGMTYLSYFMKIDSPGYTQTRSIVRRLIKGRTFENFTDDWADGTLLCALTTSIGERANPDSDPQTSLQNGIEAGKRLGVEPILTAKEMCDPEVDHIGIMAYAAGFLNFKPVITAAEKVVMDTQPKNCYINQECFFILRIEDNSLSPGDVRAECKGPDSNPSVYFTWSGSTARGTFTATEVGQHRINVYCENSLIVGCPVSFRVLADRSQVSFHGVENCSVGQISELVVDASRAGQGDIQCEARTPSGRIQNINAVYRNGRYVMNFSPSEIGLYQVSVLYDGDHITSSPFNVKVNDPTRVRVYGLDGGSVGTGLRFNADTTESGDGDIKVVVSYQGSTIPSYVHQERIGLYGIDFTPQGPGTYRTEVYFSGVEVRGSPFTTEIVDSSKVTVSGDGITLVHVGRQASFNIDTQSSTGKLEVEITAPSGRSLRSTITRQVDGTYQVDYTPEESGDHQITVYHLDKQVDGSPFICRVYDIGQVIISNMPSYATYGTPVKFQIDASKAGSGNIEIMVNEGRIPCSVQNMGNYCFNAAFVPDNFEPHIVTMKFNNRSVGGSPWRIPIMDMKNILRVNRTEVIYVKVNRTASFDMQFAGDIRKMFDIYIQAPNGDNVPFSIVDNGGEQTVQYITTMVGDYTINVRYNDSHVEGSPFIAKAYDSSAIYITPLRNTLVGKAVGFTIDVSKAGEGQLEIMVNGGNLPNRVELEQPNVYKIEFTPVTAGKQYVDINFNGESIRPDGRTEGSALTCLALDGTGLTITGMDDCIPASHETSFSIRCETDDDISPEVEVFSPNGKKVPCRMRWVDDVTREVTFTPRMAGDNRVEVRVGPHHLCDSPYNVKVFDPREVKAVDLPERCFAGDPCKFKVDTTCAGDGVLEAVILMEAKTIPHTLTSLGDGMYEVQFTGQEPYRHRVHMTFNGEYVKGSPFWVEYVDEIEVTLAEYNLQQFVARRTWSGFTFYGPSGMSSHFNTCIIAPSGRTVSAKIRETSTGTYAIEWLPLEIGPHLVKVFYCDNMVEGFPMVIKVFDASKVKMMPRGLGRVGEACDMMFEVGEAGEGKLELIVECDGITIPSAVRQEDIGQLAATFTPRTGKEHKINVTFNGQHVPGSPFTIQVEEEVRYEETTVVTQPLTINMESRHLCIDQSQWFVLETIGGDVNPENLQINILAPNGSSVPARLLSQSGGNFKVEWTPRDIGRHRVEIVFGGRQIDGSPFNVDVFDLLSIRVDNFNQRGLGEPAGFEIDLSGAGNFEPNVRIISPYGNNVPISTSNEYGNRRGISYIPEESGDYKIFITYVGFELPGCPFIQNIDDGGMPEANGDGLYRGEEDKIATFFVDVGNRRGNLEVRCDGPNSIAKTNLEPNGDRYIVTYIPVEVGVYDLEIKWNGKEIPGSPFHPRVIDPRKVKIYGGWQSYFDAQERVKLVVGEEKRLVFDVSQAGPGTMRAEIKGPNSHPRDYVDTSTIGQNVVCFTPQEQGNHYIHLFWGECTLPNSPFIGYAMPVYTDAKVILTGRGLKEAKVREQAEFIIDGSQAGPGLPSVTLTGLKAEITNKVVPLGGGKFHCTYTPLVPGAYLLNITWNDRPLRGSPYKVNVVGSFYPKKVSVTGPGLRGGMVNSTMEVLIDVRNAGPGELTASCIGPEKIALCNLHDNRDGTFTLSIVPKETGKHVLQVKYGGEHVQGSPFVFKVVSRPDASKVRVTGPGVEHGILAHFKSTFNVETGGAGAGQLNVKIRGPKGGFLVEMIRDSQKDRRIECRYDPSETGDYEIHVKWSGEHVPGSPFLVKIFDTHQELENFIRNPQRSLSYQSDSSYHHQREGSFPSSYSGAPTRTMNFAQWKAEI